MAAHARILSLNLGMQSVGLAEFHNTAHGGLTLNGFRVKELLADPGAEASRISQIKIVVAEMLGEMKLKKERVNYAIAAQSVFTRFVKLPSVEADKVDQIIHFEAQQNVPFPIDEVVWDYQLVAGRDESRLEVVLVAIKADLLDDLNGAVEEAGLRTGIVDAAPMALYNAFRYNYADVEGCSLLIDIGARTTNLLFVEPNKVFSRSIPIGGTTFTANIAKEFSEPFGAAEERKRQVGFVSLGGSYAEPGDPDVARVSKIIRNSMTRLHAEITRSISFYRAQQGGAQPQRVFLCGGSVGLPYIREFFSEKLQMPIEFFNSLRNVTLGPGADAEAAGSSAHAMGELVGLAIRSVCECPMELNLEPASVVKARSLSRKQPFIVLAGLCFLLSLAGLWLYFLRAASVERQVLEQPAGLNAQVAALKALSSQFDQTKRDIQAAQDRAAPFVRATSERDYWAKTIDGLDACLPPKFIWVTTFEPVNLVDGKPVTAGPQPAPRPGGPMGGGGRRNSYGVRLHGLYLFNPDGAGLVDRFAENLKKSPLVSSVSVPIRSTQNDAYWDFEYEIIVELKQAIAAP